MEELITTSSEVSTGDGENIHLRYLKMTQWYRYVLKTLDVKRPVGKRMAVEFENWEEEMKKKITKKVKKILMESKACVDLPDDLKEYVVKACESCLGQRSKADPGEVQKCLSQAVKLAEKRLKGILKQQLEQCLDVVLKDLSKACSSYKDEAW